MEKKEVEELKEAWWKCMSRMKRMHLKGVMHGISHNEFAVLGYCMGRPERFNHLEENLQNEKRITVSELVKKMHWTMPAASRLLKNMEEKGYIIRQSDEKDRRNTIILVTEKGRDMMRQEGQNMNEFLERVVKKMGYENMKTYLELQEQMITVMESEAEASIKSAEKGQEKE